MTAPIPLALEGAFDPRSDVFNRLLKNRVIMLGSDVNDDIANQVCAELLYLEGEDHNLDIWLYINSPGGSVTAGMAIYDTMQLPNARIMMHQPLAGLRGQAADIAIQAEQLRYTKQRMAELIAEHSGQPVEQITADSERDRWFTAEAATEAVATEEAAAEEQITLVVQVNGKVRDRIQVPVDMAEEDAKAAALASEAVRKFLDGKAPRKVILVPGKLVNIVI